MAEQEEVKRVLVKWSSNYGDEFDVDGFTVMDKIGFEIASNYLSRLNKNFEICIGTNEEIYYDCGQDFLNDLTVVDLEYNEYMMLKQLFGGGFGFTSFTQFLEIPVLETI